MPIIIDTDIRIRIVDMGNACTIQNHYSESIQTREYRAFENIIRSGYNEKTDMWSLACLIFEMLTNDFLFKPYPAKDKRYKKNDEHIAMF